MRIHQKQKNRKGNKQYNKEEPKEIKQKRDVIKIGTWNVKSIIGKEDEIIEEMQMQNIDYLGITETTRKRKREMELNEGHWLYWSGVEQDEWGAKEVWTIIVTYAPNDNERKEMKDQFYKLLQMEIDRGERNVIIMGNMNGRVGNNNEGIERHMRQQGENTKNDNGIRLIDLCVGNDLVITNTKFMHKDIHKYTKEVHFRNEKSIIDYFIVNTENWNRVKDVRVKRNAEIGSDHATLIYNFYFQQQTTYRLFVPFIS
ncbi:hypothetical protein RN001_013993 [Aquatica leii]|uniref:Endonuclease/exonuclease/phosphatase domain-containing protein n=1 Tax=Aquatica leii TaxID=1421715 RepID=A0AAN7SLU6_9COLE|nr:hypothetical protein RN001_013993 [Aquatica leii]